MPKGYLILLSLVLATVALFAILSGPVCDRLLLLSVEAKKAAQKLKPRRTVEQVIRTYGPDARQRMKPWFTAQAVAYPPSKLTLLGLKEEKLFLVFAPDEDGRMKKVQTYQVLAASGDAGPKLKQGDCQVPEGFYKIELLNPNSTYHLSMRVNYPNSEDRKHARAEGRSNLGGDIMIHGSNVSIGCIALGDEAIEEVFVLVHDVGLENVDVILAPKNLTAKNAEVDTTYLPDWVPGLYKRLKVALGQLPL